MRQSTTSHKTSYEAQRLLNQDTDKIRPKHYSIRNEQAYTHSRRSIVLNCWLGNLDHGIVSISGGIFSALIGIVFGIYFSCLSFRPTGEICYSASGYDAG